MGCGFDGCSRTIYSKGLCSTHYAQQRRGSTLAPILERYSHRTACGFDGCDKRPRGRAGDGLPLCSGHLQQIQAGRALQPLKAVNRPNEIVVDGDAAWIVLTGAHAVEVARTRIDAEDAPKVAGLRWGLSHGYARSHGRTHHVLLHRLLAGCPDGMEVDHISADTLDNRKANLRIVTRAENAQNVAQSKRPHLRGVSIQRNGKLMAYAHKDGRMHFRSGLSSIDEAQEAAQDLRGALMTHNNEARHR